MRRSLAVVRGCGCHGGSGGGPGLVGGGVVAGLVASWVMTALARA